MFRHVTLTPLHDQIAIDKCCMSLPPSFLWHLFLSAAWGHNGVYDLNTCLKSLCFVAQAFVLMCKPCCLRDNLPGDELHSDAFMSLTSKKKCKEYSSIPSFVPGLMQAPLACPTITNILHETNILWGSSTTWTAATSASGDDYDGLSRFVSPTS